MDVQVFHRDRKISPSNCHKGNGGCSDLCLLSPKGYSCACPIGIKLLVRTPVKPEACNLRGTRVKPVAYSRYAIF
jgi:Coagulation Factor Xa inhibitory site